MKLMRLARARPVARAGRSLAAAGLLVALAGVAGLTTPGGRPAPPADSGSGRTLFGSVAGETVAGETASGGAAPVRVTGVVVDGTAGTPAAGLAVSLQATSRSGDVSERIATTDAAGGFAFEALAGGLVYQVAVSHDRVVYRTPPFDPAQVARALAPLELRIYDVTDQDPGLRTDRVVIVLDGVDARRQEIVVHQAVTLSNPSAQTYVASPATGPMGLLRFALAPGASALTPTFGLRPDEIVQVDRGFATLVGVPPGAHEYGFSYRFPYQPGRVAFDLSLPYGAREVRVLVPADGPDVAGPQLQPAEGTALGGRRYRVWAASNLPSGERLLLELSHLPAPAWWLRLLDALARPWAPALALAGVLLVGLGWKLRGAAPRPVASLGGTR